MTENTNTSFSDDLGKQCNELHRRNIKLFLKPNKNISNIVFSSPNCPLTSIDDILQYRQNNKTKTKFLEYKTDYYTKIINGEATVATGNVVIELLSVIDVGIIKNSLKRGVAIKKEFDGESFEHLIGIINQVQQGKIKAKVGLGLEDDIEHNRRLSYLFYNSEKNATAEHLCFNAQEISKYVASNYKNHILTMTRTDNKWETVSALIPLQILKRNIKIIDLKPAPCNSQD